MPGVLIQIDGYDPVAAAPVTLRMASADDQRLCHLDEKTWWPVLIKLPSLGYDLFDGSFAGQIAAPSSSLSFAIEPWPDLARYMLADARLRLWTGEIGTSFAAWTLRADARVTAQPGTANGAADLSFAVDDRWLDAPLLQTYAGTGGAEGIASLKGQVKPLALGAPRYAAGTLIDPINSVFQISGYGRIEGVEVALERLARFGPPAANYASHAELVAAPVPRGRWATALDAGMVRFGAPPAGQVSFLVRGDNVYGWVRAPGSIITRIATMVGAGDKLDVASLVALNASRAYPISVNLTQQATARDLIQRIAASLNCVAGVSWLGKLFVAPVTIGTPVLMLAADGTALPPVASVEQVAMGAPWWRLAIGAERTETVHPLGDVAFYAPLVELGAYVAGTTYREGNLVQAHGSTWAYISPTPTAGNAPPVPPSEGDGFWRVLARQGANGAPGLDGVPGTNGVDGQTLYNWVAYSDAPDGTLNFTTGAPGKRGYQGQAINRTSPIESVNPTDYVWGPYRGPALFGLIARGNCVVGPDYALKAGGIAAWDSDVYSDVTWTGGCQLSFRAAQTNAQVMMGINTDPTSDQNFPSIDYAFFLSDDGSWQIYESGTYVAGGVGQTSYAPHTVFQIRYDGRTVTYSTDGIPVRVVATEANRAFYLDSSFAHSGAKIEAIAWGPMGAAGSDGAPGAPGAPGPPGASGGPGAPGRDAVVFHQDQPPANAVDGDTWITRTATPLRFYKRENGAWVQLLGDVAGLALINSAYIADLTVGTLKIADGAVSRVVGAQLAAAIEGSGSTVTALSYNLFVPYGADVTVIALGSNGYYSSLPSTDAVVGIDGVQLADGAGAGAGSPLSSFAIGGVRNVGAGWHTIYFNWRGDNAGIRLISATLAVIATMK